MNSGIVPVAILSFLLGALPFGYWLPLWFRGQDIRNVGSKNPGFTNVARAFGWSLAVPVLVLDIAKGAAAAFLGLRAGAGSLDTAIIAGISAVCGHMFSPFLRFRGGKGIATGLGILIPIYRADLWLPLLAFLIAYGATRYVSLGSLLATVAFATLTVAWHPYNESPVTICAALLLSVVVFYRHRENIARILAGDERRL
jgi:glycerol-3-phosphate acyltransferase PlsY